jgi:hypothetical protein
MANSLQGNCTFNFFLIFLIHLSLSYSRGWIPIRVTRAETRKLVVDFQFPLSSGKVSLGRANKRGESGCNTSHDQCPVRNLGRDREISLDKTVHTVSTDPPPRASAFSIIGSPKSIAERIRGIGHEVTVLDRKQHGAPSPRGIIRSHNYAVKDACRVRGWSVGTRRGCVRHGTAFLILPR